MCIRDSLKKSVKLDISVIFRAYKASKITEKQGKTLPSHLEWIADNYYIFEEKANEVLHSLKNHCRLQASVHLSGTKTPRFYNAFKEYFSMIDTALDNSCVKAFISASDERTAASRPEFADYYSMQLLFTAAVLSKVAETCSEILSNPFSSSQGEYAHELAPVSYTHLDVYKRQRLKSKLFAVGYFPAYIVGQSAVCVRNISALLKHHNFCFFI